LERRLTKLLAELREKDAELASLRAELQAGGLGLPGMLLVREQELDARRRALFEVIFEENRSLQEQMRRAN
jgi:ribosomal protein L29